MITEELLLRLSGEASGAVAAVRQVKSEMAGLSPELQTVSTSADELAQRWEKSAKAADDAVKTANEKWAKSPLNDTLRQTADTAEVTLTQIGRNFKDLGRDITKIGGYATAVSAPIAALAVIGFSALLKDSSELATQWANVKQQAGDIGLTLAQAFLPAVQAVLGAIQAVLPYAQRLADWFAGLPEPVRAAVAIIGTVVAAIGPMILALGSVISAIGAITPALPLLGAALGVLTGPIGIVVAAVAGLGLAWATWGDDVKRIVSETYTAIKTWLWDNLEPVLTPIIGLLESVGAMFTAFKDLVVAIVVRVAEEVGKIFTAVKTWLFDKLKPLIDLIAPLVQRVSAFFTTAKDVIVGVVTALYNAVKLWLLDKFTDIVNGVKAKIDAVTGFFRDMYDKVVGHSYVPDMVKEIGQNFDLLKDVMVRPSADAVGEVIREFANLPGNIGRYLDDAIAIFKAPDQLQALKSYASNFARDFISTFADYYIPGMGEVIRAAWPVIESGLKKIGQGIKAFFGAIFGGGQSEVREDEFQQRVDREAAQNPYYAAPYENNIVPGTNRGDPINDPNYDDYWRARPYYAAKGIYATVPTKTIFGEGGEPELGGPVDFMSKALAGAMQRIGGNGAPGLTVQVTVNHATNVTTPDVGATRRYVKSDEFRDAFVSLLHDNTEGIVQMVREKLGFPRV